MNELSKTNQEIQNQENSSIASLQRELQTSCAAAITLLASTQANVPAISPDSAKMWAKVLLSANVKPFEVMPAVEKYARSNKFFPAVSEILEIIRALRPVVTWSETQRDYVVQGKREAGMTPEQLEEFKQDVLNDLKPGPKKLFMALLENDDVTPEPRRRMEEVPYHEPSPEELAETERKKAELRRRAEMEA